MAAPAVTPEAIQAVLGVTGMNATITRSDQTVPGSDGTVANYFVEGRCDAPGRDRQVATTNSDSAATQAASILTQLRQS